MHHLYNYVSPSLKNNNKNTSQASSIHSLSLLSLSEYAPSRLREDDPLCVVTGLEALLESAPFESVKQDTHTQSFPKLFMTEQKKNRNVKKKHLKWVLIVEIFFLEKINKCTNALPVCEVGAAAGLGLLTVAAGFFRTTKDPRAPRPPRVPTLLSQLSSLAFFTPPVEEDACENTA